MTIEHIYTPDPIYKAKSKHIFDVQPENILETTRHQKYIPEDHGGSFEGGVRVGHFATEEADYVEKYVICPLCETKLQVYSKKVKE